LDFKLVTEYEIKNRSTLVLVYQLPQELIVLDKTVYPTQEIIIPISAGDKIEDMKDKIKDMNEIPAKNQTLIFNEEKLDDVKPIMELEVKNKSVVQLLPSITIKNNAVDPPEVVELPFEWHYTIENIKDKIHKEFSVPRK
jgi:hypothetical protein